jgi:preprotein translocase subunit SecG
MLGLMLLATTLTKVLVGALTVIHFLLCVFLIAVVLLQSGRAGDLASAFGGGPSQANVAAMSSENILTRATKISAFSFMVTSLLLALFAHGDSGAESVLDQVDEPAAAVAPAEPAAEVEQPATTGTSAAAESTASEAAPAAEDQPAAEGSAGSEMATEAIPVDEAPPAEDEQ